MTLRSFRIAWGFGCVALQVFIFTFCYLNIAPRMLPDEFLNILLIVTPIAGATLTQFLRYIFSHASTTGDSIHTDAVKWIMATLILGAVAFSFYFMTKLYHDGDIVDVTKMKLIVTAIETITGGGLPLITHYAFGAGSD